jgi:hypothetical protein
MLRLFDMNGKVDSEIEFCSLHFHEMKWEEFDQIPIELHQAILSHKSLKLKDEDSLFALIRCAISNDRRFAVLLANVRFEHLSNESIESFVGLITDCFDFLSEAVWFAIAKRLVLPVSSPSDRDRFVNHWVECRYAGSGSLNGIIAHLSGKFGGSVIDKGVVSVTASGIGNAQSCPLRVLTDFTCGIECFITTDVANSWVCYDFGSRRIRPTHYAVRSRLQNDDAHLRNWKFEGSIDGKSWTVLDSHTNDATLHGAGAIAAFEISQSIEVRMVRLWQTGKNSNSNDCLFLSGLELFGCILDPSQ